MNTTENMRKKIRELYAVHTVSGCPASSGAERFIKEMLSDFCDEVFSDDMGNVFAVRRCGKENARKIAVTAQLDEPGFVVTSAPPEDSKALLQPVGKPVLQRLCGREAGKISISGNGKNSNHICGVLLSDCEDISKSCDSLYLDLGDKNCAESGIEEGDFIYALDAPVFSGDNTVYLGGIGEKIFCACLMDIAACAGNYSFDVYYIFAAQHLLGSRGEKCAAYSVDADAVIAFELILSKSVKPGAGPVISLADAGGKCSAEITKKLEEAAQSIGINFQKNAETEKARPSFIAPFIAQGAKTGIVGAACENSGCGMIKCRLSDIRGAAAAVCAFLISEDEKIKENENPKEDTDE